MLLALVLAAQIHGLDDIGGPDKVEHVAANLAIVDAVWAAAAYADAPLWLRIVASTSTAATASAGKELWDLAGHGTPSFGDLTYDAFGIVAGVGFALAVESLVRREDRADVHHAPTR